MNDQTVKADAGKLKLTLVPRQIIKDICEVREYGNAKYPEGGPDNWKQVDIQRYRDALFRHFLAYLDDPAGVDEESGIPHYKHMACNMAFLCEMEKKDSKYYPGFCPACEMINVDENYCRKCSYDPCVCVWPSGYQKNTMLCIKERSEENERETGAAE